MNRSAISQDPEFIRGTFSRIAPRYDLANHILSGGIDYLWRARVARIVKKWRPRRLLDVATGSGDLALTLRRSCPDCEIVGSDFCAPMLLQAHRKGLAPLVAADALHLPFADATFDAVTVAFGLRNMESWPEALAEMRRLIRRGGHLLVLDFSLPRGAALRAIYRGYLHHVLPRIASLIAGDRAAYDYLAESIEKFPSGAAMTALFTAAGFRETNARALTGGIVSIYTGEA